MRSSVGHVIAIVSLAVPFAVMGCRTTPVALNVASYAGPEPLVSVLPEADEAAVTSDLPLHGKPAAAAFRDGIAAELTARVGTPLHRAGIVTSCGLERCRLRLDEHAREALAVLEVDLRCRIEGSRQPWVGRVRQREATTAKGSDFADEDQMHQAMVNRLVADAVHDVVTDLVNGAMDRLGEPARTKRVFVSDEAERHGAGVDDEPGVGRLALAGRSEEARRAFERAKDPTPRVRAAAWNAIAMAARPDAEWVAGIEMAFDADAWVRFYQYKALARRADAAALSELRRAKKRERQRLLEETLEGAVDAGGLAPPGRSESAATAATSGATTSP